jgi:hypothetical protein
MRERDPKYGAARRVLEWIDFAAIPKASPSHQITSEQSINRKASRKQKASIEDNLTEVMVEERFGGLVKGMFWGHDHLKESE